MLTISVKNFGPIAEGSVDLKPLTIFVGPSNTGKSYMATAVYALTRAGMESWNELQFERNSVRSSFWAFPHGFLTRETEDLAEVLRHLQEFDNSRSRAGLPSTNILISDFPDDIRSWLDREIDARLSILQRTCIGHIHRLHGGQDNLVRVGTESEDLRLSVCNSDSQLKLEMRLLENDMPSPSFDTSNIHVLDQAIGFLLRAGESSERGSIPPGTRAILVDPVVGCVLASLPRVSFIFPAMRSGIVPARRTLASALIRQSPTAGADGQNVSPVPGVMAEFLSDLVSLDSKMRLPNPDVKIDEAVQFIEKGVLQGEIDIDESSGLPLPDITYNSVAGKFTVEHTSSMVSELAPLILFLKYLVRPGDLLILEEPESHLHPAAQRQLARGIVRLVNAGVQVLITTHSDIFVNQINNLMRASYASKRWLREHGYAPEDTLKHDDVSAYLFRMDEEIGGSRVEELEIQRDIGVDNPEFTEAINELYDETLLVERVRPK